MDRARSSPEQSPAHSDTVMLFQAVSLHHGSQLTAGAQCIRPSTLSHWAWLAAWADAEFAAESMRLGGSGCDFWGKEGEREARPPVYAH